MVDILRVTGFVGSMITFSTNAVDVYNGLTQSNIQIPVIGDTTDTINEKTNSQGGM
jgi:fluoride ion exporter CrcB/FEX